MNQIRIVKVSMLLVLAVAILTGCGMARTQQQQQGANQLGADGDRLAVSSEAANKISQLPEVRRANVIVTNRNAYVAAVLEDNYKGQLTREVENKVANQVRSTDPSIQNVYVSTNPDFVNRMNTYSTDIQQGRPVAGLFEEFNEMVRRVFPNPR